jgi:branched-chain amino acid transport system permease protein
MNKKFIKPIIIGAVIVFLFLIPLFITGNYPLHVLVMLGMSVILASSLRLIYTTGLLSLGHGGMMAIGAYTSTLLVVKLGFSPWAGLWIGAAAAAVLAVIIGFPFVRLRGMYFSLVTIFFSQIITSILGQWRELTGGTMGMYSIPTFDPIVIPGILNIDFSAKSHYYYLILVLVLISLAVLYAIEHSRTGMSFRSIKQSDSLSEAVGINTTGYKVLAFAIGSFFAGLTGAFFAHFISVVVPSAFGFVYSIYVVVYMVFGGTGGFIGPIIGSIVLVLLPEFSRVLKEYQPYLFTGILIIIIFFLRDGLISLPRIIKSLFKKQGKQTSTVTPGE